MKHKQVSRIVFITGTDTGVGKTLLTCLLLRHLRRRHVPVFALKPFCSGSRGDARLLHKLQQGDLELEEINPYFFPEPLAPLVAARNQRCSIRLSRVLAHIRSLEQRLGRKSQTRPLSPQPVLLIEGAGGLLAPLGPRYSIVDLIRELRCEVIVVSRNQLGTINHTWLTISALQARCAHLCRSTPKGRSLQTGDTFSRKGAASARVVLMQPSRRDPSTGSNPEVLAELLAPVPVIKLPFFGGNLRSSPVIEKIEKKIEKTLARILD